MIPIYRHPYGDEHVFGWLQDLAAMNGTSFRQFCSAHMDGMAWDGAVDSVSGLACLSQHEYLQNLLYHNTILPAIAPFMTVQQQASAIDRLLNGGQKHVFVSCRYMRICPDCLKDDLRRGITPYYRAWHQLSEVTSCAVHNCRLFAVNQHGPITEDILKSAVPVPTTIEFTEIAKKVYTLYQNPVATDRTKWHCAMGKRARRVNRAYRISHADLQWVRGAEGSPIVADISCAACGTTYLTHPYADGRYNICHTCRKKLGLKDAEQVLISLRNNYVITDSEVVHIKCGRKLQRCSVHSFIWSGRECGCLAKKGSLEIHKARIDDNEFSVIEYVKDERRGIRKVKIRHSVCGGEFTIRPGDFISHRFCRVCSQFGFRFITDLKSMVGADFDILTPTEQITGGRSSVRLKHTYCGTDFSNSARNILSGQRCPFCATKLGADKVIALIYECFDMNGYSARKEDGYIRVTSPDGSIKKIRPAEAIQELTRLDEPVMFGTRRKRICQPISAKAKLYVHYKTHCDPSGLFTVSSDEMHNLDMTESEYWSGIQYLVEQGKIERTGRGAYRIICNEERRKYEKNSVASDVSAI